MKGILTPEEKQYLRRTSNYLRSLGMREGLIEIEMENWEDRINHEDIRWNDIKGFSNNYSAEIPQGLYPILKKVVEYVDSLNNLNNNIDDISIQRIEIRIECDDKQIVVSHEIFYYDRGEQNSIGYDSDEDIERFKKWMNEDLKDVEVPSSGVLTIQYNGGGDSGYIENSFDETGNEIPAGIEDWCYQELENHFGGWEINEGSDGRFIFDFNEFTVFLDHTYNTEEQQIDTLYEENFDK